MSSGRHAYADTNLMKRKILCITCLVIGLVILIVCLFRRSSEPSRSAVTSALKGDVPDIHYNAVVPRFETQNLRMIGRPTRHSVGSEDGAVLRTLRLKPITDAVEYRYMLPQGILLAMVAQESHGSIMLNGNDDGGVGFCHMQPSTASEFGLKIYKDCRKLVDHVHGRALRRLMKEKQEDLSELISFDSRFHPIINIDAAGRMLAIYMQEAPRNKGHDALQHAVYRYSGRLEYWDNMVRFRGKFSKENIARIRKIFNKLNPKLIINGEPAGFDGYLSACWREWDNYELPKYKCLELYAPNGAPAMCIKYGDTPRE